MFQQLLTPVGDNLFLSFLVAAVPIVVALVMLGVLRRPAWQASAAGLVVALVLATTVWSMPVGLAADATLNGIVFALWPVMWIVVNALLLYNVAVASGRFERFREWMIANLPDDRRVVLVVVGFCFGALLEGISGFGTPIAITSALLILVGFEPIEALTFTLIFNTAPVAFGALGVPITVLGQVTHLSDVTLGRHGGPATAVHRAAAALLRHGGLRRAPLRRGTLAGSAGGGRLLRAGAVPVREFHRLQADRRIVVARLLDRDPAVPPGLATGSGPGLCGQDASRLRRCPDPPPPGTAGCHGWSCRRWLSSGPRSRSS